MSNKEVINDSYKYERLDTKMYEEITPLRSNTQSQKAFSKVGVSV